MPNALNTHVWNTACFYTVLKNTSGKRQVCSFLPPHGVVLAANATVSILGDVVDAIAQGDRVANAQAIEAYLDMLARRDLTVVSTPAPILKDGVTGLSKTFSLTSGTIGAADPCWATSVS